MRTNVLFVWLAALLPAMVAAAYSNFTATCTDVALDGFSLSARCLDESRSDKKDPVNSSLDLNLCLGIDQEDAHLIWSVYGKFANYCSNCTVQGSPALLSCVCAPLSGGSSANTSLNLDARIGNKNGTLACW
ncbi:Cyanovirin-N [Apodospora peruviana]|uniref:Cyanovirin-N n=1 Tax=Apodospora peruviana TaxID=516989 RepID=A0AAE0IB94_9PEZI|nr:Cyanovirin-N [Apodospora peruviana]